MGIAVVWIGAAGSSMPSPGGWLARSFARLQHYAAVLVDKLSWVPNWLAAVALIGVVAMLVRRVRRRERSDLYLDDPERPATYESKEETVEREDA
jgi:hypothetical protein